MWWNELICALQLRRVGEPDASGFNQGYENPNDEIHVLSGCITGRGGQLYATAPEKAVQGTLMLHNHARQRAMKNSNGNAKQ